MKKIGIANYSRKNNFKTYMTQTSKILSDLFISGFTESLDRNISSPITNILGAIDLLKEKLTINNDNDNKILEILEMKPIKLKII